MNYFEQQLKKLFEDDSVFEDTRFAGRACFGRIGDDIRVRAEFKENGIHNQFDSLMINLINRREGAIDSLNIHFSDLYGKVPMSRNPGTTIVPHLWINNGKPEWYGYMPTPRDISALREAARTYVDAFREPAMAGGMQQQM